MSASYSSHSLSSDLGGSNEAGPSTPTSPTRLSSFRKWRHSLSVAGRRRQASQNSIDELARPDYSRSNGTSSSTLGGDPYTDLRPAVPSRIPEAEAVNGTSSREADAYEWEVESNGGETDGQGDVYSWIDPSELGTTGLRSTVSRRLIGSMPASSGADDVAHSIVV